MLENRVIYLAILSDSQEGVQGYKGLFPKEDGWYTVDSEGNEVRLQGFVVVDKDGTPLQQREKIKFASPLKTTVDEDKITVSFEGEGEDEDDDFTFMHDNEFHTEDYATQAALAEHTDNTTDAHGLDIQGLIANSHAQNTDTILDEGGDNEVSAEDIKKLMDGTAKRGMIKTTDEELNVSVDYHTYIADTSSNNVSFVLPSALAFDGETVVFRKSASQNAMTIDRSGDNNIVFDDSEEIYLTFDNKGDWVSLQSDGSDWHVITIYKTHTE